MKVINKEELEGKSLDELSDDELRWLKDHNRLSAEDELKYFKARHGVGGASDLSDVEYTGDEGTRNTVAGSGLHPEEDLSGIDRAEVAEAEVEALKKQLAEAEAQRDAALEGAKAEAEADEEDEDEDEYEDPDYENWSKPELQAEAETRGLSKNGTIAELAARLRENDEADEG